MMSNFKNIEYKPEYKDNILKLMDSKTFKSKIWEWQFHENPEVDKFTPILMTDKWGSFVGFNGVMPVRIKDGDKLVRAIWSCDFYVDERFRGKGLGKQIKQILKNNSSCIMALGISESASRVHFKSGWKSNLEVEAYQKINNVRNLKSIALFAVQLYNRITYRIKYKRSDFIIEHLSELPDTNQLDELWGKVGSGYDKTVIRDGSYLKWKYEDHPLTQYEYICVKNNKGNIDAILIVRISDKYMAIVDYVGPGEDMGLKFCLVDYILKKTKHVPGATCTTSDQEFKKILLSRGFRRSPKSVRFHLDFEILDNEAEHGNWFIMSGDSDADLLLAARDGPYKRQVLLNNNKNINISCRRITEDEFIALENEWEKLLKDSDANPLFLGWTWQLYWWQQWSRKLNLDLYMLGAYSEKNKLVGLAPLYKRKCSLLFNLYQYTQIQFIGSSWGHTETVRSEYLDFIVKNSVADDARKAFYMYIEQDTVWDQFIFTDIDRSSQTYNMISEGDYFKSSYIRIVQQDITTYVETYGDFIGFLSKIGKHTRHRLINRRNYLRKLGEVHHKYADSGSLDDFFNCLNKFHLFRWGKECFPKESLAFHKRLAKKYNECGRLKFAKLTLNDKPISILYNIEVGGREYNIQAGFDAKVSDRLSLGLLHLGMAIESAFNDENINYFDLLAGPGKNVYYKSHFGSKGVCFIAAQINRQKYLKYIYKIYDNNSAIRKMFRVNITTEK